MTTTLISPAELTYIASREAEIAKRIIQKDTDREYVGRRCPECRWPVYGQHGQFCSNERCGWEMKDRGGY